MTRTTPSQTPSPPRFGPARSIEIVAIDGRTAAQPELLWRQGEHTLTRLREANLALPEATTKSLRFEPRLLADELEPLVEDLRRTIGGVEVDRQEAALTHGAKERSWRICPFGRQPSPSCQRTKARLSARLAISSLTGVPALWPALVW